MMDPFSDPFFGDVGADIWGTPLGNLPTGGTTSGGMRRRAAMPADVIETPVRARACVRVRVQARRGRAVTLGALWRLTRATVRRRTRS